MSHQGSSSYQVGDNPPLSQGQGSHRMTVKHPLGPPSAKTTYRSPLCPQPQSQHCPHKQITSALGTCPLRRTGERANASLQLWITLNTPPRMVLAQDQPCCSAWCLAKQRSLQPPCMVQAGWNRCKKICPLSMVFAVSPFSLSPHKEIYVRLRSARHAGSRLVGGHNRAAGSQACKEPSAIACTPDAFPAARQTPSRLCCFSGMFYNCRAC